jgi:diaminopimelate decarboxylase
MASDDAFHYRSRELQCENVPLASIAERFGTPAYIYSRRRIMRNLERFEIGLADIPHLTCYSVKANSSLRILKLLADAGAGFDIVSGGELARVLRVGANPERIVFSGVGKTEAEINRALRAGILMFNVESRGELEVIQHQACRLGKRANISIRINPDVEAGTHPYISTGQNFHKFGVAKEAATALYHRAAGSEHLRVCGIACHIGSQILEVQPFLKALDEILAVAQQLRQEGIELEFVDLGGGFGIRYANETPLEWERLTKGLALRLNKVEAHEVQGRTKRVKRSRRKRVTKPASSYRLIVEPGRSIVADAGALLTRVLYVKRGSRNFVVADAGMNDLMRPALYGSYHEIIPVRRAASRNPKKLLADVVGPLCETGDFLARDRELPEVQPGDLLAVLTAGAYGYALASNYNSRPRPVEVMVEGHCARLIRERQSDEDLMAGEVL